MSSPQALGFGACARAGIVQLGGLFAGKWVHELSDFSSRLSTIFALYWSNQRCTMRLLSDALWTASLATRQSCPTQSSSLKQEHILGLNLEPHAARQMI